MPRDIRGFEPLPPSDNSPFPDPSPDEIGVWSGPDVRT